MKANEAPEKIYSIPTEGGFYLTAIKPEPPFADGIEYTRTDAFIEKACEWLKENFLFDEAGYCKTNIYSTESMIYNFKNTLEDKL